MTLRGDFIDWFKKHGMDLAADGAYEVALELGPGVYAYKYLVDEKHWVRDAANPRTESAGGRSENSLLVVGGTEEPVVHAPARPYLFIDDAGQLVVRARLRRGEGDGLDLVIPGECGGARFHMACAGGDRQHLNFEIAFGEVPARRLSYVFEVIREGKLAVRCGCGNALTAFDLAVGEIPSLPRSAIAGRSVYRIVLDRFRRGGGWLRRVRSQSVTARAGGDLAGIVEALPHVADLGVDSILLTPVGRSPSYHRYDLLEPLLVDPALGTEETLRSLIDAAHGRSLSVFFDCAISHVHPEFFAFADVVAKGERSRYADWFFLLRLPVEVNRKNPAFLHYPDGPHLPMLNTRNPEVVAYLEEYVRRWTSLGIDGWRLDAVADVPRSVFERLAAAARSVNAKVEFLSELVPDGAARYLGRPGEVVSDFPTSNAIVGFFCQRKLVAEELAEVLKARCFRFGADLERMLLHLADLDQARPLTLSRSPSLVRLGALFLFTMPCTPLLLYGDEVGLSCTRARQKFEQGLDRLPMPWHEAVWDRDTLRALSRLLWLRAEEPLSRGDFQILHARGRVLAWARGDDIEEAVGVVNVGDTNARIPLATVGGGALRPVYLEGQVAVGSKTICLGARSGGLFMRTSEPTEASGEGGTRDRQGRVVRVDPGLRNLGRIDRAFRRGSIGIAHPSRYYLNLTQRCNLSCEHCITNAPALTRSGGARDMDPRVLERLKPCLAEALYVGLVHAGEPTIAPLLRPLLEVLRESRRGGPTVVHLLTNGMTLTPSRFLDLVRLGVNSLSVSVDGTSAATNDSLRRGSRVEKLRALLPELARVRREESLDVRMGIAYTVTASNVHEVAEAVRVTAAAGMDWIKLEEMYPVNDRAQRETMIAPEALARAIDEARSVERETGVRLLEHLVSPTVRKCSLDGSPGARRFSLGDDFVNRMEINPCRLPFELACVEPNGDVKPLSFHHPRAGNLLEDDFEAIWNGQGFRAVREQSLRERTCGTTGCHCPADEGPAEW